LKTENGKVKTENSTAPANCPPETGWTRSEATEGVDKTNRKRTTPITPITNTKPLCKKSRAGKIDNQL
jgi:hypothetical protein